MCLLFGIVSYAKGFWIGFDSFSNRSYMKRRYWFIFI